MRLSTNSGATWRTLRYGYTIDSFFVPAQISVNPFDISHILVSGQRYTSPTNFTNVVIVTFDRRDHWTDSNITASVVFSPAVEGTVVSTAGSAIKSDATGGAWVDIPIFAGLTPVAPKSVAIAPPGAPVPGAFFVSTDNGVYTTGP